MQTGTYHLTGLLVPEEQLSKATGGLFLKYFHIIEALTYSEGAFIRAKEEPAWGILSCGEKREVVAV